MELAELCLSRDRNRKVKSQTSTNSSCSAMSVTVNKLTKAVSELELNELCEEGDRHHPSHKHQHSTNSTAKLLTKYAAPGSTQHTQATATVNPALRMALATQPTNFIHVPKAVKPVSSLSNLKSQIPSPKKPSIAHKSSQAAFDIGKYDGGLELENERRGSTVSGEAAQQLALDSSIGR
jgi:hypothetical protein